MSRSDFIPREAARILGVAVLSLLLSGPAQAQAAVALPDPSGVTLFTLGVAGVLIGRYFAGKRKD